MISSLAPGKSHIENVLLSRDTFASINCVKMLGVSVSSLESKSDIPGVSNLNSLEGNKADLVSLSKQEGGSSFIRTKDLLIESLGGRRGFKTPDDVLFADNSGTTFRLATSMCSLVNDGYSILTGDKSLRKRPMGDLIKSLDQLGVGCFSSNRSNFPPLVVKGGGIKGGTTQISGKISSQFISSLLLSGIYSQTPITIQVLGNQVSKPYIDSTIIIMKKFGITVENSSNELFTQNLFDEEKFSESKPVESVSEEYRLPIDRDYKSQTFRVPADFSTAALLMSAAIMTGGELVINNLDFSLPQGDMEIIPIINKMGGRIEVDRNKGLVKIDGSAKLEGGNFNLVKTPDLLPVLAILSLKAKNKTMITGVSHARYKETDRVSNISSQLIKFGAQIEEENDSITIHPPDELKSAIINSFDDHRLFMAFTIAGLSTEHTVIDSADSVDVSFPNFVGELKAIGAHIEYMAT